MNANYQFFYDSISLVLYLWVHYILWSFKRNEQAKPRLEVLKNGQARLGNLRRRLQGQRY